MVELLKMKKRPKKIPTVTYKLMTGCGPLYLRITHIDGKPFEVFPELGKPGGCTMAQTEAIGKAVSIMLRVGVDPAMIIYFYKGIQCGRPMAMGEKRILSCPDAVAHGLEQFLNEQGRVLTPEEKTREYWES